MITMNEKDKNEMLDSILNEKEEYLCKLWGVLMADSKTYAAIGGLSAIVGGGAYIGVTEQHLNFVVVDSVDVRNIKNRISIPMECITKAEVKGGLLPGRKVVTVYFEKNKLKISLMNNAIGSDIQGQKENVERVCQMIQKACKN